MSFHDKYERAQKWALEYNKKTTLKDFNWVITVKHLDGTKCEFHYAFFDTCVIDETKFVGVLTEHNGHHVYFEEDLEYVKQGSMRPSKLLHYWLWAKYYITIPYEWLKHQVFHLPEETPCKYYIKETL